MAEPAPCILGSTLLAASLARVGAEKEPISLGCSTIDTTLQGGFRYGQITSIAGATSIGKTLVLSVPTSILYPFY